MQNTEETPTNRPTFKEGWHQTVQLQNLNTEGTVNVQFTDNKLILSMENDEEEDDEEKAKLKE